MFTRKHNRAVHCFHESIVSHPSISAERRLCMTAATHCGAYDASWRGRGKVMISTKRAVLYCGVGCCGQHTQVQCSHVVVWILASLYVTCVFVRYALSMGPKVVFVGAYGKMNFLSSFSILVEPRSRQMPWADPEVAFCRELDLVGFRSLHSLFANLLSCGHTNDGCRHDPSPEKVASWGRQNP